MIDVVFSVVCITIISANIQHIVRKLPGATLFFFFRFVNFKVGKINFKVGKINFKVGKINFKVGKMNFLKLVKSTF